MQRKSLLRWHGRTYHRSHGETGALSACTGEEQEQGSGSINYVADYVMDILDDTVGAFDTDIVVTTTIDPTLQSAGERRSRKSCRAMGQAQRGARRACRDDAPERSRPSLAGATIRRVSSIARQRQSASRVPHSSLRFPHRRRARLPARLPGSGCSRQCEGLAA